MSLGRTFKLNSGYQIPAVGLGTWVCSIQTIYDNADFISSSSLSPMKLKMLSKPPFVRATVTLMLLRVIKMRTK